MLMSHYGRYSDFDLATFLQDAVHTVNGIINPTPKTPVAAAPPVMMTTASAPLFTVGGFQVTPVRALVGAAAIGAVIYFANKKKRRR